MEELKPVKIKCIDCIHVMVCTNQDENKRYCNNFVRPEKKRGEVFKNE